MTADPVPTAEAGGEVRILLDRKRATVAMKPGETLLESARRAGMGPPFSCEAGNCGTGMGKLTEGTAEMRVNDALVSDERAVLSAVDLSSDGAVKLSFGKKKHILLRPE